MTEFKQQLEKVFEFFRPGNLAKQKIKYEGEIALLVIDVQKKFCDPKGRRGNAETKKISKQIQSLVPEFRKAGIPVYAVYFGYERSNPADIDFYKFAPEPEDVLVAKSADSAFQGSNIKELLQQDKRKLLLTCGFNLSACVMQTVLDAREAKFDVCLLRDLVGNDSDVTDDYVVDDLQEMLKKGVAIEQSDRVLELVRARKNALSP